MNQFEIQYKKQIADELPDLWDRIESAVDDYEKNKTNQSTDSVFEDNDSLEMIQQDAKAYLVMNEYKETSEDSLQSKKRSKKTFSTLMKFVAAAACLIVTVNVIRTVNMSKDESAMYDSADSGSSYSAAYDVEESYFEAEEVCASDDFEYYESDYAPANSKAADGDSLQGGTDARNAFEEFDDIIGETIYFRSHEDTSPIQADDSLPTTANETNEYVDDAMIQEECEAFGSRIGFDEDDAVNIFKVVHSVGVEKISKVYPLELMDDQRSFLLTDEELVDYNTDLMVVAMFETDDHKRYFVYIYSDVDGVRVIKIAHALDIN